jgi:hypothetical protein
MATTRKNIGIPNVMAKSPTAVHATGINASALNSGPVTAAGSSDAIQRDIISVFHASAIAKSSMPQPRLADVFTTAKTSEPNGPEIAIAAPSSAIVETKYMKARARKTKAMIRQQSAAISRRVMN